MCFAKKLLLRFLFEALNQNLMFVTKISWLYFQRIGEKLENFYVIGKLLCLKIDNMMFAVRPYQFYVFFGGRFSSVRFTCFD